MLLHRVSNVIASMPGESDGASQWVAHTSPYQRVLSTVSALDRPRPVDWIVRESCVDESDAIGVLNQLERMGIARVHEHGADRHWGPRRGYVRSVTIQELVESYDRSDLIDARDRARSVIDGSDQGRDRDLAEYRLELIEEAIDRM